MFDSILLLAAQVPTHPIVHVNASLNALATVLLVAGYLLIKLDYVNAHRNAMLSAFGVSTLFLACYLYYHYVVQFHTKFTHPGAVRYFYLAVLLSHIVLAVTVPFLAIASIVLGMRSQGRWLPSAVKETSPAERLAQVAEYRRRHIRLSRWTFPIWLYVSITGVIVYAMLYHLYPPAVG